MFNSAAEVYEQSVQLRIGQVEEVEPSGSTNGDSYPFRRLRRGSGFEQRTYSGIVLENSFLRATALPELGGRIISLIDKRTGCEVLRRGPEIEPRFGSRRGIWVREGVRLLLDGDERLNSLGVVSSQIEHSARDDSQDAAFWMAEFATGTGISFHVRISVPSHRAEVRVEAHILNRWLRPQPYNGGIATFLGAGVFDGVTFRAEDRDAGLSIFPLRGALFDGHCLENGDLRLTRFSGLRDLAARQVDSWTVALCPLYGMAAVTGASPEAVLSVGDGRLKLLTTEQRLGHKLVVLTSHGQALEMPVDLYPEHVFDIGLGDIEPRECVLLDPAKQEVLRVSSEGARAVPRGEERPGAASRPSGLALDSSPDLLRRATFDMGSRHLAHTLLAMQALGAQRYGEADTEFEEALNFNAVDPLLWWGKAVCARLAGADNEAELLNAHYLAPLDPALRAEGFLSRPVNLEREGSVLLAAIENDPEDFVEVACLLIELRLFDQAGRWIDEALRHVELPKLRYLMAYCHLTKSGLMAEAAEQIRLAAMAPAGALFPFRDIEHRAITALAEAFPKDSNLRDLARTLSEHQRVDEPAGPMPHGVDAG